ncbi:hypothetical protein [Caminibacter pacificus]|uniref:Uncharacterized protein n=1 Tax=Caminibacter pacificus TaxID=1424653 RepID=A0AAJ4RCH7_9BACT|nr:hypothetical protein [Caminibacter pacificus]NPA87856.1 hypothetical protein [Campylobacterota bacterium]QCI28009.1 hypothetical protein C6V80_03230 [Caminibacter pacificus]ROR39804.1 hypothetical protein EDC58_0779 [Caminibacter pacificus]
MKKLLLATISGAVLFAFNMQVGKTYQCQTVGISFKEGNQTRNIPANDKTKEALKKALGDIYSVKAKLQDSKDLSLSANGKSEVLKFRGKWKNYNQYVSKSGALIFMPDKNTTSDNAALIVVPKQLIVFYKCK